MLVVPPRAHGEGNLCDVVERISTGGTDSVLWEVLAPGETRYRTAVLGLNANGEYVFGHGGYMLNGHGAIRKAMGADHSIVRWLWAGEFAQTNKGEISGIGQITAINVTSSEFAEIQEFSTEDAKRFFAALSLTENPSTMHVVSNFVPDQPHLDPLLNVEDDNVRHLLFNSMHVLTMIIESEIHGYPWEEQRPFDAEAVAARFNNENVKKKNGLIITVGNHLIRDGVNDVELKIAVGLLDDLIGGRLLEREDYLHIEKGAKVIQHYLETNQENTQGIDIIVVPPQ